MSLIRLARPNQSWFLALESAFADPSAPTVAELNAANFVFDISCGLTEDGTELTLADSETDDTMVFCSIGNESTPTFANVTASITWLKDANTGGSGSTADLTSLYNQITALLGFPAVPYWFISRTGPDGSQGDPFAVGQKIKMALFETDYEVPVLEQNAPVRGSQSLLFSGQYNWNYTIAS